MVVDFLKQYFEEVDPMEMYRFIFPEGSFEERGNIVPDEHKYNGIINYILTDKETGEFKKSLRLVVTDDLKDIKNVFRRIEKDSVNYQTMSLMNGISYIGNRRISKNAREMYAMIVEIDELKGESFYDQCFTIPYNDKSKKPLSEVTKKDYNGNLFEDRDSHSGIRHLCYMIEQGFLPKPTFIVSSGSPGGIHLYYVFEEPILLYPDTVKWLTEYRRILVEHLWLDTITNLWDNIQYESLFQSFRMVGSQNKVEYGTVRGFWFGTGEKTTMEKMMDCDAFLTFRKKHPTPEIKTKRKGLTLEQAKKKYPDWYQRIVVDKEEPKCWTCKKDLYEWWKREIREKYTVGHRYYCLMCLSAYAIKCGVEYDELEKDMWEIYGFMKSKEEQDISNSNPLTPHDLNCALQTFLDAKYDPHKYTIELISDRSGIEIKRNKRNGRSREVHIKTLNAMRKFQRDELGEDAYANNGRKPKQEEVIEWRYRHPDGTKAQCIKDTGLSKPTVYKWWTN